MKLRVAWMDTVFALAALACMAHGANTVSADYASASEDPGYRKQVQTYQLPDVKLVNQYGQKVDLQNILSGEQPVMVNFIFTSCPTICPVLTASFASVQKSLAASSLPAPVMVSISIDPAFDTPDKLLAYSRRYHARGDWYFLTGRQDDILQVLRSFDAYRGEKMNHVPVIFIRGGAGETWVRLTGYPSVSELLSEYAASVSR